MTPCFRFSVPGPRKAFPPRWLLIFGGVLAVVAVASACCAGASPDRAFAADTHAYFAKLQKLGFAGVVVVDRARSPIVAEGFGLADRERNVRWSPSTISDIGSITKQFTGAAILLLQEQGKLAVTDSLPQYFEGVPQDKRSITLHQLLTHTSGISDLDNAGDYDAIERDEFMRRILAQPLSSPPGTQYEYSNAGYSILGAIIEKVTGASYETFVRERLFLPQGMKETGYVLPKWDFKRVAKGYAHDGPWGTILEKPFAADGPYWVLRANGGIHSTPPDMIRWGYALLDGKVLSAASMKSYWTPHVSETGDSWYGYGWSIQKLSDGSPLITHNGGNGIYFADMAIIPGQHIVAFLQTNVADTFPLAEGLLQSIEARLIEGTPYPSVPEMIDVPESRLSSLAGTYRFDADNSVDVASRDHGLQLTPHGGKAFALVVSTRKVDPARCDDLSARIKTIASAFTNGDYAPLAEAYEHRVTPEVIQKAWTERVHEWESAHGKLTGFDVIGTAMLRERDMTLVRFNFERGNEWRAYVWDKDAEHRLLGSSARGLAPDVHCVPVPGGGFASWDPLSGDSRPFAFETAVKPALLHVSAGDQVFDARRTE